MSEQEEYRHLRKLRKGNEESFRWIYTKYFKVIYLYCHKLIGVEALTKDATSEVFITLWKKRKIVLSNQSLQPFLYRIAKFTAYNYLKKIANDNQLQQQFLEQHSVVHGRNGEQLLIEKEELATINDLIETLPPKRRAIFKMRYFEGKGNQAIAEQFQISIHTVKVHLVKARRHLKKQLVMHRDDIFHF